MSPRDVVYELPGYDSPKVLARVRAPHVDVSDDALSYYDGRSVVCVPWPYPQAPGGPMVGHWEPAVLERYEDGTALGLWRWVQEADDGDPE